MSMVGCLMAPRSPFCHTWMPIGISSALTGALCVGRTPRCDLALLLGTSIQTGPSLMALEAALHKQQHNHSLSRPDRMLSNLLLLEQLGSTCITARLMSQDESLVGFLVELELSLKVLGCVALVCIFFCPFSPTGPRFVCARLNRDLGFGR